MPRAGDAFLNGTLPLTHDPLGRIDYSPNGPVVDLQAFIDALTDFLNDTIFPILKDITGLDFSSPENFFFSLVTLIVNGGSGVAAFVEALVSPILDFIKQLTGIDLHTVFNGIDLSSPGAVLSSISSAIGGIVKAIIGAITGSSTASGDLGALGYLLGFPVQTISALTSAVGQLQQQLQAGFARVDGRIDAIQNSVVSGATNVGFDNFNRTSGIGSGWTAFPGVSLIQIFNGPFSGGYVQTNSRSAGYFNAHEPTTDKHGVLIKVVNKNAGTCRALLSCDTAGSNYAAVEVGAGTVGDDYVRIVTGSSPTNVVAHDQRNVVLNNDYVIDTRYDPASNEYIVMLNNNELFRWEDEDNIVTHGSTKRKCGILSNGNNANFFGFGIGFAITDFTFYDW